MVNDQMLDGMTREQLVSLLYSILRRLLFTPQPLAAPTDSTPCAQEAEGGLVIDPTIDAWEHTGIYRKASNQLPKVTREPLTIFNYGLHLSLEWCQDLQGQVHLPQFTWSLRAHLALPSVARGNQGMRCRRCLRLQLVGQAAGR